MKPTPHDVIYFLQNAYNHEDVRGEMVSWHLDFLQKTGIPVILDFDAHTILDFSILNGSSNPGLLHIPELDFRAQESQ